MESFRAYVLNEKMNLEEDREAKRIKLEQFDTDTNVNTDNKASIVNPSSIVKNEDTNEEIKNCFLHKVQLALLNTFSSNDEKCIQIQIIKGAVSETEYIAHYISEILANYKCLAFEKFIEIEKSFFQELIIRLKDENNNLEDINEEIKNKIFTTIIEKCPPKTAAEESSSIHATYNNFPDVTNDYSSEMLTVKLDSTNDLKNKRPKVTIVTTDTNICALDSNESPFIPIKSQDYSINISNIEKDDLEDGFTENSGNEKCDSINVKNETDSSVLLEKIEKCESSDDTLYYTIESSNPETETDDDCVIINVIEKSEKNNLLDSKPDNIDKLSNDSSVQIIESDDKSVEFSQESKDASIKDWDFMLGPLKIKYYYNSEKKFQKYVKKNRQKDASENKEEDLFANWW